MPKVKFTIITLFEDAIRPYLETSMMRKAQEKGILEFDFVNLRDFGLGPHKSVDDTPYGGGDGMVLRPEPVYAAVESILEREKPESSDKNSVSESKEVSEAPEDLKSPETQEDLKSPEALEPPEVILPTPDGQLWTQALARQFAGVDLPEYSVRAMEESIAKPSQNPERQEKLTGASISIKSSSQHGITSQSSAVDKHHIASHSTHIRPKHYIIICPHYEGYDARILKIVDHQICLGPYVLTGGELPALIIIDSIVRLLPGVLGGDTSAQMESFSSADGQNIEAPQYTKPYDFRGMTVPDILLSGDHKKVAEWRQSHERYL